MTLSTTGQNHSIYYTTDDSTPVPANAGMGSTTLYTGPFTVDPGTVVKAVGMWGQSPQPLSYSGNYGFSPSGVSTKTAPPG